LVKQTRAEIVNNLQGNYGCKRFLRDGHQTVVEDHHRMHYETGELGRFEHIESEWPLFFTYLMLDGAVLGNSAQTEHYRKRLDNLLVEQDGQKLLPELYFVPADLIEAEKADPGSQPRQANENLPLVWAQSLYLLGNLVRDGLLQPGDIDPLNRRERVGRNRATTIQVSLLAEDRTVQRRLRRLGIDAQTLTQVKPIQVRGSDQLARALSHLGENPALGLTGRPPRGLGSLITSQVFTLGTGENCVFLPPFLRPRDFYLNLDNRLLTATIRAEMAYIHRHWDQPGEPLVTLLVSRPMLQAEANETLMELLRELQHGSCADIPVRTDTLQNLLPRAGQSRLDLLGDLPISGSALENRPAPNLVSRWRRFRLPDSATLAGWRQETDTDRLRATLAATSNPFEQSELLALLWLRLEPQAVVDEGKTLHDRVRVLYGWACRARAWSVIRQTAGLLGKIDDDLEHAVADIVIRQHRLALGHVHDNEAVIVRPLGLDELAGRIHRLGCSDPRERVLIQEILLMLGMLVKAQPRRFRGILTLRAWQWLSLLINSLARESDIDPSEALDRLAGLSPSDIFERMQQLSTTDSRGLRVSAPAYWRHETRSRGLQPVRFTHADNPVGIYDWAAWREASGVITRVPEDFYSEVWGLLRQFRGVVIGDQLDGRNYLESLTLLADTTPAEKGFALRVDQILNNIHVPEYRQLSIEALQTLFAVVRANPSLRVDTDAVLDQLIDTAVRLYWQKMEPKLPVPVQEVGAEAWRAFYASPPHEVANMFVAALGLLLADNWRGLSTAA